MRRCVVSVLLLAVCVPAIQWAKQGFNDRTTAFAAIDKNTLIRAWRTDMSSTNKVCLRLFDCTLTQVTSRTQVFKSTDGGTSWDGGQPISERAVDIRSPVLNCAVKSLLRFLLQCP